MNDLLNAMTVDVEDYFHVSAFSSSIDRAQWGSLECRVERNTERLLDLFDEHQVKITFFVLGWVAERYPALIKQLHARGHEVACHGLTHELVYKQTPEIFRDETSRSKALLEDLTGSAVIGYRAASYSITRASLWAFDILEELGFQYDSSVFPIRHDVYGIPGARREPYKPNKGRLLEIPLTTVEVAGQRLPCAGGGYFRLLPYGFFPWSVRRVNAQGLPAIFYLHPWEIDPEQPRIAAPWKSRFRHYTNLSRTEGRLRKLLKEFRWGRMDEVFLRTRQIAAPEVAQVLEEAV